MELAIDNIDRVRSLRQLFEIKESKTIKQNLIIGQPLYKTDEIYNYISQERLVFKDRLVSSDMFIGDVETVLAGEDFVRIYNANNRLKNKPRFSVLFHLADKNVYREYARFDDIDMDYIYKYFWDKETLMLFTALPGYRHKYLAKVGIKKYKSFLIPEDISYRLEMLDQDLMDMNNTNPAEFDSTEEISEIIEDIKEEKEEIMCDIRNLKRVKELSNQVHDYYSKYNFLISAKSK